MPKMDNASLQAMLASQHQDALSATNASTLSAERAASLAYYMGDMSKDMPVEAGRSSAVSMDVSDTIEGMMPSLMEIFTGSDEVVRFDPVGPEDVEAAKQETDYVNHVFMNQNPGFLTLYSFIKDALLSKVGIVKVWWETEETEEKETYLDKTDDEYAMIVSNPDVEVIEHSAHPVGVPGDTSESPEEASEPPNMGAMQPGMGMQPQGGAPLAMPPPSPIGQVPPINAGMGHNAGPPAMLHDVVVVMRKKHAQAYVMGVPPEEFGIERGARSIRECNYCFHKVSKTIAELLKQGYDPKQVKTLSPFRPTSNSEEINRDSVDESRNGNADETNDAARQVEVVEHYVKMDYKGDGKPCLYKVTTGSSDGGQGQVLRKDGKPDIEEFDSIPFAAMTPIIITHRFFGRSIADIVMDIQRIKTALLRALLDNAYLANNPRVEVAEAFASDSTLDDLLVSRPGGIVRTKQPGGLNWQVVPTIGNHVYPLLEYQDATREWRTGVTRQGQGIDANALQNQSATAVNQAFTAAQARIRLIARIFAETGIRDLFWLLHATIKKHGDKAAVARLRNNWVNVDPRNWKTRNDLTVSVGLGTGSKQEQMGHMMQIAAMQKDALINGLTNLVGPEQLFNTAKEITKLLGKPDTETFFTDPKTQPPPKEQPNPEMIKAQAAMQLAQMQAQLDQQKAQMEAQLGQQQASNKAQIEQVQAQADVATQQQKTQAEMAMNERKAELEEKKMMLEYQLKTEMQQAELQMKREMHEQQLQQSQVSIAAGMQAHEQKMQQAKAKPKAKANG